MIVAVECVAAVEGRSEAFGGIDVWWSGADAKLYPVDIARYFAMDDNQAYSRLALPIDVFVRRFVRYPLTVGFLIPMPGDDDLPGVGRRGLNAHLQPGLDAVSLVLVFGVGEVRAEVGLKP